MKKVRKEKFSVISRILGYALKHKSCFIPGMALVIIGTALSLLAPVLTGMAIDSAVEGGTDFSVIARYCVIIAACVAISGISVWTGNILLSRLSFLTVRDIRRELFDKLLSLPLSRIERHSRGDLMTRMTAFGENLSDGLYQGIMQLSAGLVTLLMTIVCMYVMNWAVATLVVLLTPVSAFVSAAIAKRNRVTFAKQSVNMEKMSGLAEEHLSGTRVLRSYGRVEESEEQFAKINRELFKSGLSSQFAGALVNPVSRIVNNIIYAVVAIVGGVFIIGSDPGGWASNIGAGLTLGGLSAFLAYANQFAKPFNDVTSVTAELQTAASAARRIFELTDQADEDKGGTMSVAHPVSGIEFRDASFSYSDKPFMEHITFAAKQGQKIALVGTTGSGKTTIINLIMRFYDITGGRLIFDGNDIENYPREGVRRAFGMVLQDTWLFNGSIEENIRYGKLDATHEDVVEAAKAAYVHRFVQTLPGGYDMVLNEEASNVSQGQKQLLTIARAILADPKILILDEATSSVDTRTEVRIQKAMDNLMQGRTSFIIAHRLSTIRDADLILVMKDGDIIEQGSHEELLAKNGFYAELYNSQFEKSA